jgi:hypothetical protein
MRKHYLTWAVGLALGLSTQITVFAQTDNPSLRFRTGAIQPAKNASKFASLQKDFQHTLFKGNYHVLVQFDALPSDATKAKLAANGIKLLTYMPDNAYTALVSASAKLDNLESYKVRAFFALQNPHKADAQLLIGEVPNHAEKQSGYADLNVVLFDNYSKDQILADLSKTGAKVLDFQPTFSSMIVRIAKNNIKNLVEQPFVLWAEPIDRPMVAENVINKNLHRSTILDLGTRNLTGDGIRMGIWDGGQVGPHFDFGNRLTVVENVPSDSHATHVAGTMAGGGVIDPRARGMAAGALVYSHDFQGNIPVEMQSAITNFNITLTQNSYGGGDASVNCTTRDMYSATTRNRDLLMNNNTSFMHVFSAGNSQTVCTDGWGTTTAKADKNNLTCGNLTFAEAISGSSSYGPLADGRIKPEISGMGTDVFSTYPNNTYATISGTSMATPGVSGTVAQLYQRFRQLNANALPLSSLIRGVVCNTADDVNNVGPDYRTGFGRINGLRAVKVLEGNTYTTNNISTGNTIDFPIAIPANTAELRVMLTWNDPAALANANPALTNNLNLQVIDPTTNTILPWTLDPANPGNLAVRAVNNRDNIEQVTMTAPAAGNYILRVIGTAVPSGPQQYSLTWEVNQPFLELTFPSGTEILQPNAVATVQWNGAGIAANQTLEYSLDNGATWVNISTTIANTARSFDWTVPAGATGRALIRVSQAAINSTSAANFHIIGTPSGFSATAACTPVGNDISWAAVTGATGYDVMLLNTTTGVWANIASNIAVTNFSHTGLTAGTEYWYAVRARNNANVAVGQRTLGTRVVAGAATLPAAPVASNVTICTGNTATLTATGGGNYTWYDAAVGGTVLANTPTYTTPVLAANNTYFVERKSNFSGNVGPADNVFGTGGVSAAPQSLLFSVFNPSTLVSVTIFPDAVGNAILELRDAGDVLITSTTRVITAAEVNTAVSMTLNWNLPPADYRLSRGTAGINLYRNLTGATYPYTLANAVTITASTAGNVQYYWAYNWVVTSQSYCPSPRTAVNVTIGTTPAPTISYGGTNFCGTSTPTPIINGTLGGTFSSTAGLTINATTGQITTATSTAGTYTVTYSIAAAGGCNAATATTTVIIGAPTATIAYGSPSYCQGAANPTPTITGNTSGVFSSTAGLNFVSTSTGQINTLTSTTGNYVVTYTIAAANGCPAVTTTFNVAITAGPGLPSFANANTTFAVAIIAASPAFNRPNEGVPPTALSANTDTRYQTFSITPTSTATYQIDHTNTADAFLVLYQGTFTPATPLVNVLAANDDGAGGTNSRITLNLTAGQTYIVVATTFDNATNGTGNIIITPDINTPPTTRCQGAGTTNFAATATNATLTYGISPVGAGTIDAAGLVTWNATFNGVATITATATGTGTCTAITRTNTATMTVNPLAVATFNYAGSPFCITAPNPLPNFTGGGVAGTFSATPAGLVFVSTATGQINLTASAGGTYTVTNTPVCGTPATTVITITTLPITTAPTNATTCVGGTATFTAVATGATGYQWQEKIGAAPFTNITNVGVYAGATSTTLTLSGAGLTAAFDGRQYQCVITDACGNVTTTPVTLTINVPSLTLAAIPSVNVLATSFTIPFTAILGAANQYSIATGLPNAMPGFVAVPNTALPASPITVNIPASAVGTYNFNLTVRNTTTGCSSVIPFTVTVTLVCPTVTRLFVNKNVVGGLQNGTSWANAFTELAEALRYTQACPVVTEVWVARGTYLPQRDVNDNLTPADLRTRTFRVTSNLAIYGGFVGTETTLAQRVLNTANETILSGDIDATAGFSAGDTYNIITTANPVNNLILDGFVVTGNNGTNTGALRCDQTVAGTASLTLRNNNFRNNRIVTTGATQALGAAAFIRGTATAILTATIENTLFVNNTTNTPAGILAAGGALNVEVTGGSATFTNCVFANNAHLGNSAQGGAVQVTNGNNTFNNCVFVGNSNAAANGGALLIFPNVAGGVATLNNNTFINNTTAGLGSHIRNSGSAHTTIIKNSIFWGGGANRISNSANPITISYSTLEGGNTSIVNVGTGTNTFTTSLGNASANPIFADIANPIGADNIWRTADDGLALAPCSPIVDAGDAVGVPTTDILGRPRFDMPGVGTTSITDIGAYEVQSPITLTLGGVINALPSATSFNLTYTSTVGSPNQYSISAGTPNAMAGFVPVTNAAITTSPLVVPIPASPVGVYNFNLTVRNTVTGCVSAVIPFVVFVSVPVVVAPPAPASQVITFDALPDRIFSTVPFTLGATASSGLGVSYTVVSGNLVIGGNTASMTGLGEVVVEATQRGNFAYLPATPVRRTFRILPAPQSIVGFDSIPDRAWNSGNFFVNARSSSGLPVVYTVSAGQNIASFLPANPSLVLLNTTNPAVGRVTITATVPAGGNFAAATTLTRSFNVVKANQSIGNIIAPFNGVFNQLTTATVSASATSNLPVTTTVTGNATIAGNTLTINGAGTITLTFAQAGNDLWNAATNVVRSFVVAKADQTIRFTQPVNPLLNTPINLAAVASSNLPVAIRIVSGTGTFNGSLVTATAGGEMVLELTQAGNDNFNAAPAIRVSFIAVPNLTLTTLSAARFCGGASITVNYTTDGAYPEGNVFVAYISDASGSFNNAIYLGSVVGTGSGSLVGTIPTELATGTGYRVQVRSIVYGSFSNSSNAISVDRLPERPFINYAANGDLQLVTPAAGLTFQWFSVGATGATTAIAGATSATFKPTANGAYQLGVISSGCTVLSNALSFSLPVVTSSNDFDLEAATEIYPNPHQGSVNVKTVLKKAGLVSIVVTDVLGKTVYTHKETVVAGKYEHSLNLESLASGVYLLALTSDGKVVVKKTVKQ